MIDDSILEHIRQTLAPLNPAAVYVFGSTAKDRARRDSDLDLAILSEHVISPEDLLEAKTRLSEIIRRDVDLIDLSSANTVLRKEVLSGGRLLYALNAVQRANFEMYTLSDYARLNEERAPVLAALGQPLTRHGR